MGCALGIPDSGLLLRGEPTQFADPNEPLDKLLLKMKFRQSLMAFADSSAVWLVRVYISMTKFNNLKKLLIMVIILHYAILDDYKVSLPCPDLVNDYWSSTFFMKLKKEANMRSVDHELDDVGGWNFSHRLSSIYCVDDPLCHDHSPSKPDSNSCDYNLGKTLENFGSFL
ncbi:unnamed protein product [Fraxinus pennsylvanica]|uniref:Uncharacterized protein n=1 Tax=Fraxinus pennsylvanica TaxID=56036 RepID=A0AAD2DIY8_9LAMI|nr:unnamed protein product [Fraxinus pennsylvanica]